MDDLSLDATDFDEKLAAYFFAQLVRRHAQARRRSTAEREGLLDWAMRFLPEYFRLPPSKMHHRLAALLERATYRRGARLNVLGPRGSAKSTVASFAYPLWATLEHGEPYVWLVSDTQHQARAHLETIRSELENNTSLRAVYGDLIDTMRATGARIALAGRTIEAYGTGQRIRGKRRLRHRPTLIIADDVQNDEHMLSPRLRAKSRDWFFGSLVAAGTPETNIVHLATALHHQALGVELTRTPGWHSETFRALIREPEAQHLWARWREIYTDADDPRAAEKAKRFFARHRVEMERGAEVLWPEREDLYTLMCLAAEMGPAAFAREKQNQPASPEACEWPDEYFTDRIWCKSLPEEGVRVIAVDPSKGGDARTGDYSAIVIAIADEGRIYVDADLARRSVDHLVHDTTAWCGRIRPHALGIEANQFQELLAEPLQAELTRRGQWGVSPWLIRNHVDKRVRIRRLGPLLARDRLRFAVSPGTRLLVEQLRAFPTADHDDGPDALEMAVRLLDALASPVPGERAGGVLRVA